MNVLERIQRRAGWYKSRLMVQNAAVGRLVEICGNTVRMDGLTYSVDCPSLTTAGKSVLAFGLHEMEERELIRRWLPPDLAAVELGGGLGVVSCLTNTLLNNPAQHVVIEANPRMVPVLTRNRDLNRCRFKVVNKAIAYDCDSIELKIDPGFVSSRIDSATTDVEIVPATTLTKELDAQGLGNISLIADIEGAEEGIIRRELPLLGERVRFLMFEMHPYVLGEKCIAELLRIIEDQGFKLQQRLGEGDVFSVAFAR